MTKTNWLRWIWALTLIEGVPVIWLLAGGGGQAGGLSTGRLVVLGCAGLAWLVVLAGGAFGLLSAARAEWLVERGVGWMSRAGRYPALAVFLFALGLFALEGFVFSFMFWPEYMRSLAVWVFLASVQVGLGLHMTMRPRVHPHGPLWPSMSALDGGQRKVLGVLALAGLVYFCAFIPANLHGIETPARFEAFGGDEVVIYPILTTMLTPGPDLRTTLYRVIEYDDYHYGYPFYVLSALVVLPSRLIFGSGFESHVQVNVFLLRQVISVLPLVFGALVLTYLGTRFRSLAVSLALFVLILSVPGVVKAGLRFWHPDGLAVLLVALTLYFLRRDRFQFGRNFYMAALFCGLSVAVRLVGVFFALSVGGYLLVGWLRNRRLLHVVAAAVGFVMVMVVTYLLADPYLFDAGARSRMMAIMVEKSGEMAHGYNEPDPEHVYRKGFDAWAPFFEKDFAQTWFSLFLMFSMIAAALAAKERAYPALLLGWCVLMGGYLIFFVAAKAFQYSLPLFAPMYSAAFLLPRVFSDRSRLPLAWKKPWAQKATLALCYGLGFLQLTYNIARIATL